MRERRGILLLAIFLPVAALALLQQFWPLSFGIVWGYVLAVALLFKSALLSLWLASKLKIVAFLKGLTLTQAIALAIKRWFIDNVLSRWIKRHILSHFREAFSEIAAFYRRLPLKAKIKNTLLLILPLGVVSWLFYTGNLLGSLALTAEIKLLVSGFFKALWLLAAQAAGWFSELSQSWLAPLLEFIMLGFLLEWLERRLGPEHPLNRFLTAVGNSMQRMLEKIGLLHRRHVTPFLRRTLSDKSRRLNQRLLSWIHNKKIGYELLGFDALQNSLMRGHIDAYHTFPDMAKITDKRELYRRINARTDDRIEIIGFVSRDRRGNLTDEKVPNDFYYDLFILEGIASDGESGVTNDEKEIDRTDFWVLNMSRYPVTLESRSANFQPVKIAGKSLELVRTMRHLPQKTEDIVAKFRGRSAPVVPVKYREAEAVPTTSPRQ